jgi:SAM-dependent methyltransferase
MAAHLGPPESDISFALWVNGGVTTYAPLVARAGRGISAPLKSTRMMHHKEYGVRPKPELYSSHYAEWFKDADVVGAYPFRPPYAPAAIEFLSELTTDRPRRVLDIGCGTGDIARRLAPLVDRVHAVDFSAGMIEAGRQLPGGAASNVRWITGAVEDVPLDPPYALVTAGESLHWMDWEIVLPRLADVLSPNGFVAIVGRDWEGPPAVRARIRAVLMRHSAVRWQDVNLLTELHNRDLFTLAGTRRFGPDLWQPTIGEYLECRHSQRSFARSAMGEIAAGAFDTELRQVLTDLCGSGEIRCLSDRLQLSVETAVVWGRPRGGQRQ